VVGEISHNNSGSQGNSGSGPEFANLDRALLLQCTAMSVRSTRRGAFTAIALALLGWGLAASDGAPPVDRPAAAIAPRVVLPPRPIGAVGAAPVVRQLRNAAVADELVIAPRGDADAAARAIADVGGQVAWRAPRTGLLLARFATADDARAARAELARDRRVGGVFANHVMHGAGIATSPRQAQQWMLSAMALTPGASPADGVVVAVLDTGAAYEDYSDASGTYAQAPDLAATPIAPGWDFVSDDAHPNDDHGHGTHITNIIAASSTTVPMAPGATIMPIKVLDASNQGTELALAEGIRYAVDHGAQVINMSLSFPPGYFPSRYLQDAIDYADAQGVVMVAAAGNQDVDGVDFPAAFRDVIAVGASRLSPSYQTRGTWSWLLANLFLVRAEYSNRGDELDVVAPAGAFDGDANGDGVPEAVVAQSFAPGQPTHFEYLLWAGTSQAAAEVSGLAAAMLHANPSLTPRQVQAVFGEQARPELGLLTLSPLVGRGYLLADAALAGAAAEGDDHRPRYSAALRLAIANVPVDDDDRDGDGHGHGRGGDHGRGDDHGHHGHGHGHDDDATVRAARAQVQILDDDGAPVRHVWVYGTFSGGVSALARGRTDDDGNVTFVSPPLDVDQNVVGFQVDAVADRLVGARVFVRPRGALYIDSCSLELLSANASGEGIATSPLAGQGFPSEPGQTITGEGVATSPQGGPGGGTDGQGIATSPGAGTLPGIATSPLALHAPPAADEVDTYSLVNFSWTGSTLPMVVAVDSTWFAGAFPDAQVIQSSGAGIATSPVQLDPQTAFAAPVAPATDAPDGCSALVVRTFVPGEILDGLSPAIPAPTECGTDCTAQRAALSDIWAWAATGQGIATSPSNQSSSGMTPAAYDQAKWSLWAWSQFAMQEPASPVSQYGSVLEAAGIATSPGIKDAADQVPVPLP